MALASTHTAPTELKLVSSQAPPSTLVLPSLLRCLVVSWSDQRARMLQSVAKGESWQAEICNELQDFLRTLFQSDAHLTIVDLPHPETAAYEQLRQVTAQACGMSRSLFVVCGTDSAKEEELREEELWARQLGIWTYLPGLSDRHGLEFVFAEARKATAKQSSAYVEACGYH